MNFSMIYVLAVVIFIIVLLYKEVLTTAVTFLLAIALLIVGGVLNTQQVLLLFANEQVAVILMLLILGKFLKRTDWIESFFQKNLMNTQSSTGFKVKLLSFVTIFSGFINNTPLVALLIPYINEWTVKKNLSPSKFLIPLSYAAIMGGGLTLIGTSSNLIANSVLVEIMGTSFSLGMFDFTILGLPLVVVGLIYLLIFGDRLLPNHKAFFKNSNAKTEYLVDLRVQQDSCLVGKSIEEANLRKLNGLYLVEIVRRDEQLSAVKPNEIIEANDYLIFAGATDKIIELVDQNLGLEMPNELKDLNRKKEIVELVIPYNSSLARKKIKDSNFRAQFDAAIIAVRRDGEKLYGKIGEIVFKRGDMLLCVIGDDFYKKALNTNDITLVSSVRELADIKGIKAVILMLGAILAVTLAAFKLVSLFNSLLVLLVVLLVTKVVRFGEVKRNVNINLLVIMAGALAMGAAINKSGAAEWIATVGLGVLHEYGIVVVLGGLYLLTNILAAYMTNIAAISVVLPIALSYAQIHAIPPVPLTLCIAFAGSKNFITPIGYQTNLMVYGPGNYKFKDFMRIGWPLSILFMLITISCLKFYYF